MRCMTFADCRLQTADRRLQTADCMRQQDCKLNETKNIVIKVESSSKLTVYWSYFLKVKKKCKSKCRGQDGFVITIFNLYTFTNNKF